MKKTNLKNEEISILKFFDYLSEDIKGELKKQGKSKNQSDDKYCSIELEIGELVELEHVDDIEAAREIAKDHLEENPHYYTKVLAPKENEVRDIALKVLKKHNFKSIKDYLDSKTKK